MTAYKGQHYVDEIKFGKIVLFHMRKIKNAFNNHGKKVTVELKRVVSTGSRSGRVYSFRGKKYTASAPGEPPAKRSGNLARKFKYKVNLNEMKLGSEAFSKKGAPYPFFLEGGTKKMAPRPWFIVTINRLKYRLQKELMTI